MKKQLVICLAIVYMGCNSSSTKEETKQTIEDTVRTDNTPSNLTDAAVIEPQNISVSDIPASIKVKGKVQEAWKWTDKLGVNFLITSAVAQYDDINKSENDEETRSASLHAVHYAGKNENYSRIWVMEEMEKACPFDITCNFLSGSSTITDLDNDGIAEAKVQYTVACRSDVSPATMKLKMYEKGIMYALWGFTWLPYSLDFKFDVTVNDVNLAKLPKLEDESAEMLRTFGRYEHENDFTSAPPEFLSFARNEWLKYVKEKMGE